MRKAWCAAIFMIAAGLMMMGARGTLHASVLDTCDRPLIVGVAENYIPYSEKSDTGVAVGLDISMVKRVLWQSGCAFEFVFLPWPRALEALERGKIDIVPYASDLPERKAFALFSKAYRNEVSGLVVRSEDIDQFPLTSVGDIALYNMKVAYLRGSYRGEAFAAFLEHPEASKYVSEISISHHGLNLLLSGRIDAYVSDPVSTLVGAQKRGLEGRLAAHPLILNSEPVHLMFSRATVSQKLVSRIDDAITAEIETDRYASAYGEAAIGHRASTKRNTAELVRR